MANEITPVAVSTKILCALFDLTRQRVNQLEKDPGSDFPQPSRIGRSVRHNVEAVAQWLETKKNGNSAVQQKSVQRTHPTEASPITRDTIQHANSAPKTKPTTAEVRRANARVFAATPKKGQRCVGNLIETADGVPVKYFRLIPRHHNDPESLGSTHQVVRHLIYLAGNKPVMALEAIIKPSPSINANQADHSPLTPARPQP